MNTEILIVEDEGLIALDLKKKLEQVGYTVPAIVDNAEDALLSVENLRPSLVLMDIRLQGHRDGIETADEIRRRFHVPVMFVTAHADRATLERARIVEPFGYIVKPFHSVDFRAQIEMVLWKHQMEQKVRTSEAWLSTTFRNVADALIATDSEGNIAFINPPAARLTGWDSSEAQGQPLLNVFHVFEEVTGLPVVHPFQAIQEGRTDIGQRTYKLLKRCGSDQESDQVIVDAEISANLDEGAVLGAIVVFRDVTERRRAESQTRQLQKMDALALMATGLGRELAESQERMDVSLKYLIERSEGSTMRLLWDVYERSAHQQSVVQQMISLGRSDAGQSDLVDLNGAITGLAAEMETVLGIHRSLNLTLDPGIPLIRTDPRYLRENLLRLVADARSATSRGGVVEISTTTIGSGDNTQRAQVTIRDNGKILRTAAKERAFEPYYQSRPGKRNPGFSLALVYQFVALSGGCIEVENEAAGGSAYLLSFPAADRWPGINHWPGIKDAKPGGANNTHAASVAVAS